MPTAYVVLLVSNLIFATGYSVSRIVLEDIGPATLAMARLTIGSLILVPWAWRGMVAAKLSREDHWRLALTGVVGFTLAFALGNWGLAHSTASNAALLITVEPAALILLSPLVLGERLSRREGLGAALAILGAAVIVVNGIPGVTPVPGAPLARGHRPDPLRRGLRGVLADRPARAPPPSRARGDRLLGRLGRGRDGAGRRAGVGHRAPVHVDAAGCHRRASTWAWS